MEEIEKSLLLLTQREAEQSSGLLQWPPICNVMKRRRRGAFKTADARSACFVVTEEFRRPMSDMNERLIETNVAVVGK